MKLDIYVETSVISYLTALPSRDLATAARQQITRDWWRQAQGRFTLYVSQAVLSEAAKGDVKAAEARRRVLDGIDDLNVSAEAIELAASLVKYRVLPERAAVDALHVSVAAVHGMDYLVTWNCKHLANAFLRDKMANALRAAGYRPPVICTPEELMED